MCEYQNLKKTTSEAMTNSDPVKKANYRVTNWAEYDQALVNRGDVTVWFDQAYLENNWFAKSTGKRGAPKIYSDEAIQVMLTLKVVFKLPFRALEGFGRSLMRLMGLDFRIPDHSNMSRRGRDLTIEVPIKKRVEPIHLVVDSTGLKIYGEGEWKIRKHGKSKRRHWVKVHLGVDANEKDVLGIEVTTEDYSDSEMFESLVTQVDGEIARIYGDGAYDTQNAYEVADHNNAELVAPPRENAIFWKNRHPRNTVIMLVFLLGMALWKTLSGYHKRSIAENAMYRLKQLFGTCLSSRSFATQNTEVRARIAAMNTMTYLGMPKSIRVGVILS